MHHFLGALAAGLCLATAGAQAQPKAASAPATAAAPVTLAGKTLQGQAVDLAQWRGKVVMLFYWNTSCVVCLEKMPELRANAAGWRAKPFVLVLVSTDRRRADVDAYMRTVQAVEPDAVKVPLLWAGEAGYRDTAASRKERLPLTVVLDTKGQVAHRIEGRMAPEAWDAVADLMP
ncbi:MAG TPA: TlpA disulfide reductase family protein [Burkholderiaceae bacterium]|nr:TlpA disulfide reductase family protein [Burkholderiaceae bacterium]